MGNVIIVCPGNRRADGYRERLRPKNEIVDFDRGLAAEALSLLLAMTFGEPAHRSNIAIINGAMKPATHMFCFVISLTSFRDLFPACVS